MASHHHKDDIPEFSGDVSRYRDLKRAVLVQHAGQTDEKRALTAPRVLARLRGEAHLATRHLCPEQLRSEGEEGLKILLDLLDKA